jgi:glycosyltransferase involved in cell wall biosynthesis
MASPALTVIIPTYNWSNVLPFSIGSVLGQSFADFELLVVGDGCTDDSEAVVRGIGDPRVRWINLPRHTGHQSGPNNEGLRQARGELIAYLGHDDLWLPHHLEVLGAAIAAGADMAYGITRQVADAALPDYVCEHPYRQDAWLPPSAVVHRRSVTEAVGGWTDYRTIRRSPETELWARIHGAGYRLAAIPRLTVIKFPASRRRNVYRERPSHEQQAWLARIRSDPALEAAELARLLAAVANRSRPRERPLWKRARKLAADATRPLRSRIGLVVKPKPLAVDVARRFKGLEPVPAPPQPARERQDA